MTELATRHGKSKVVQHKYNTFIKQLDIEDIRLTSAKIENLDCYYSPSAAEVRWRMAASYENREKKIEVFHRYNVRVLEKGKELKAKVGIVFCVTYKSKLPMTDKLFEQFKDQNLPVNTWPYFREFVHNTVLRMGWPPFIAPTFVQ